MSRGTRARLRALVATAALVVPTALVLPALSAGATQGAVGGPRVDAGTVALQFLNVSDFHGQLDPLSVGGTSVGGAAALSAYFAQERAANPNTVLLTSGDAVGASPPLSSFFGDVPTIEWMNRAGFDAYAVGNHDFDAGLERLQQQVDLAEFAYVGSNLREKDGNVEGIAPLRVLKVDGVKVALIGITNPEAPTLVTPGNLGTLDITEPVAAAMRARAQAEKQGATVFVAFGHLGVTGRDASGEPTGPLVDFARGISGFDLVFGDHTDRLYEARINGALVQENLSKGATYSRTTVVVDRASGEPLSSSVVFRTPVVSGVTPDPAVKAELDRYRALLGERLDVPIGTATDLFPRSGNNERLGEAAIGNLVTDALRATYGTQIAFTNGGGLRSPLPSSYAPADTSLRRTAPGYAAGPPYDLVLGDAYTLLPFGNTALTRTVTGAQLHAALEHSVAPLPSSNGRFLQVSGFRFSYDLAQPAGSRVVAVTLDDGTAVPDDAGFTLTAATNDFTNAGGDGYAMLADGQGVTRELLATVVAEHITRLGTVEPVVEGRITRVP